MTEPVWINEQVVQAVHRRQLAEHSGGDGVRDATLLDSALNKPKNLFHYAEPKPDLAALAAAYAYGICRNHPFVDGNKRTALIACQLFLRLNEKTLNAPARGKYETTMALAEGKITEEALTDWIRKYLE